MVRIRLKRVGAKKHPFYRVVVSDQRTSRDGSIIEQIGTYDPFPNPSMINIDTDKLSEWIGKGAQPSESVISLMFSAGIKNKFTSKIVKRPAQPKEKKKAPKDEAPKDEAPKDEAPKDEAPKDEATKDEAPKDEAPKDEATKDEAPKDEVPKNEATKDEAPKDEVPKDKTHKDEVPKDEVPKEEAK